MALKPIAPVEPEEVQDNEAQDDEAQDREAQPGEASQTRSAANRANAQHSTGPRTPEGKARSSQNALKHGLYSPDGSQVADLLGQDRGEFDALLEDLREEYAPAGRHEERMVERLALLWWRLERLGAVAQTRLAARLDQGADAVEALLESEQIAPAEARLERAIAHLHKDLLFLRRYRERAQQKDARGSARSHIAAMIAQVHAEGEALMLDARRRREAGEAKLASRASNAAARAGQDPDAGVEADLGTDPGVEADDGADQDVGEGDALSEGASADEESGDRSAA